MATWPGRVREYLQTHYGTPDSIDELRGKSGAAVYRVRFSKGSVIVKLTINPAEATFYERIAPALRQKHIPIPNVEWVTEQLNQYWLLLEDIPQLLPRERWFADDEVLTILCRLHTIELDLPTVFRPQWTASMTAAALSHFDRDASRRLQPILERLQENSQLLFQPDCLITADPNPTNWGIRDTGEIVLFDWERFCYGVPALDLAIIVPGLGDDNQFRQIASAYLTIRQAIHKPHPVSVHQLSQCIAVAKVWVVIEFLYHATTGQLSDKDTVTWLVARFESWLANVALLP